MSTIEPEDIPGGPKPEDRTAYSKNYLKVTETLTDTWLADPKRKGMAVGDWDEVKSIFPNCATPCASLAPKKKNRAGKTVSTVLPEVPVIFSDPKVSDLLHSESGLEFGGGKISLINSQLFVKEYMAASPQDKKIIQLEKVNLQAVGESLAACTVTKTLRSKLDSLSQDLVSKNPSEFNLKEEIAGISDLAQLADAFSNRLKKLSTTNEMLLRLLLRKSVFPRLKGSSGEQDAKDALLYTDFGWPTLFGPVNSDNAETFRPGTFEARKYKLDVKNDSNKDKWGSSFTPPAKRARKHYDSTRASSSTQSFPRARKPSGRQKARGSFHHKKRKS